MKSSIPLILSLLAGPALAQTCPVVMDIKSGAAHSYPRDLTCAWGNTLYFSANSSVVGWEPHKWTASGGLQVLRDINPGTGGSGGWHFTPCCTATGPVVFFVAGDPTVGQELFSTDGTTLGTKVVADVRKGPLGSGISEITALNGKVYFTASNGQSGQELWVSDGTQAGTRMVLDVNPGRYDGLIWTLQVIDGEF